LHVPSTNAGISEIVAGQNGVLWFDERGSHSLGRIDATGTIREYPLPSGVSFGPYTLAVTPDGHVWTAATGVTATDAQGITTSQSMFEFDAQGKLLHTLSVAQSVIGAISVSLHPYVIAAGADGLPYVAWGPYPYGMEVVQRGPVVKQLGFPVGDIPTALALAADGRVWFVVPNANFPNYGYIEPGTLAVRVFHGPKGIDPGGIVAGPGNGVAFTAGDNFLYRVETGISGGGAQDSPGAVAPSSIAASLPTPAQAFADTAVVITSVALAAGGTLFITFPAQFFNLTFQENYPAIAAWLARRRRRRATSPRRLTPTRARIAFAAVVAAGALCGALLDPGFGRSWSTMASYLAIVLALVTGAAVTGGAAALYHWRSGHPERPSPAALPLGLAVAAICVLISRLVAFQPGYLYGVVCGLAFHRKLSSRQQGHVATMGIVATLCVSVLAWIAWVPVHNAAAHGAAFPTVVLDDFLATVFVSGMVGSAIGLLPLRFLSGGAIREWRPPVWAGLFTLAMFGVVDVLVRSPASPGAKHAPLVTTIVLFVAFGGFAIAFREYFARRWRREHGVTVRGFREWLHDLLSPHAATPPADVTPRP
jgi:hypothetical protein